MSEPKTVQEYIDRRLIEIREWKKRAAWLLRKAIDKEVEKRKRNLRSTVERWKKED